MKTLLNLLLKTRRRPRRHPPKPTAGYTMIELLVGMVIAFLIITPMLAFVVDILNRDVREQAKTNTEQDLQAAIDYISQDISQALRIYTPAEVTCIQNRDAASCVNTPTVIGDPAIPTDVGTPKIVFWKRKHEEKAVPINDTVTCPSDQCDDTFVMSLVAYYQIDENDTSSVWCDELPCPSRIARLEISDKPKDSSGNYVDGDPTDNGYNPDNVGNMASPENLVMGDGGFDSVQVLVNHIEEITLHPDGTNNKLAKITIVGNAKSRISGQFSQKSCDPDDVVDPSEKEEIRKSPYCPKATAQVGARSGFGE